MPKVKVKDHVRDPVTGETFLRSDEAYEVEAVQAYRLVSEAPESVEEQGEPQAPEPPKSSSAGGSSKK